MADVDLLDAWERGAPRSGPGRALALLSAACPAEDEAALAALPVGRRDALLLSLHERVFGTAVVCVADCPRCSAAAEVAFDAAQVRVDPAAAGEPLRTTAAGAEVRFRLPTTADLLAAAAAGDVDAAADVLLARCVVAGGDGVPADALRTAVATAMAAADPQADVSLAVACPACAHEWAVPFDVASFLWDEVEGWAARTLLDVHALASAYGWTEGDVLSLGPVRRRAYLALVGR